MLAALSLPTVFALSLDGLKPIALDMYDRMQRDWWATAYWGAVWLCGFIATFLLLRMLFTRWGDRDVMKKTLGLSLLVHMLFGMLSTSVIFGPGLSSEGASRAVGIRRVVIDNPLSGGPGDRGEDQPAGDRANGASSRAPAWDRAPRFDARQLGRLERQPRQALENELVPQQRTGGAEPLAFPAGDPTDRSEQADPFPEPDRRTARLKSPAEAPQAPIAEETAEARPEATVGVTGPARGPRATPGTGAAAEIAPRRTRPAASNNDTPAVDYGPDLAESSKTSDPRPVPARGADPREPPRMARGNPKSQSAGDSVADDGPPSKGSVPGPSAGRSPVRIGRTARSGAESGTLEPTRLGTRGAGGPGRPDVAATGSAGQGSTGTPDGFAAARSSAGDPDGDALIPSVVRSEIEGAIGKGGGKVPATYRLRTSPARKKIAIDMGANEASERAVETSLQWLADHQHALGYWEPIESTLGKEPDPTVTFGKNLQERERSGFNAQTGLTALAVLAFLGKGYTHEDNPFSENVDRALHWLIGQQDSMGFLGGQANSYARMYCHGMATIAIGEAYGMTKDSALREPLARAVQYIVDSQNADGGWRYYKVKQGDMSMFGWQLMALKSAKTAGLAVPQGTMIRATDFLIVQGDDLKNRKLSQFGGLAAYRIDERPKPSMTAEALFCKQMLGIKRTNRASVEAVDYLLKNLPQRSKQDLYYWYYGTLAVYHHGGEPWRRWNQALRDNLVADQRSDGDFAGSWNPRAPWGDYGGRVFSTTLSTLCLEVYYRFLPLYQTEDGERLEQSGGQ